MMDRERNPEPDGEELPNTAHPIWPGKVETFDLVGENGLNEEQDARAMALYHARSVLARKSLGGEAPPSTADMIRVARWILEGDSE